MWKFYCIDVEVESYAFLIHVWLIRIQCDLDACKYCPVVTMVDKNDDRQCLYLWGVLE